MLFWHLATLLWLW